MSTILREQGTQTVFREQGIQTVHDQVVSEVAQRWAKAFQCKVTIKTAPKQNLWADPKQLADIAGWYFSSRGNSMEWIAEVETEESLSDPETRAKWKQAVVPGVPMYVLVPRGNKVAAEKLAIAADIQFSSIYEYAFFNGVVQFL